MAEPILDPSGLAKANFYGQSESGQQEMLDAAQQAQEALQQRYANPNWFNVAAGFLKPQLGGFGASLGSASQALGDWQEKQRANELPVAQYRAQVALMKNQMSQNRAVNKLVEENAGSPITPELVRQAIAHAPEAPATKALQAQYAAQSTQRGLESSEQGNAINRITLARQMGKEPNPSDLALIASGKPSSAAQTSAPSNPTASEAIPTANTVSVDQFHSGIHGIENPNNLPKGTGVGTAPQTGPGQMTDATLLGLQKSHKLPDATLYGKDDSVTKAYDTALTKDNQSTLNSLELPGSALNHRVLWHYGAPDATKLLGAKDSDKVGSILSPEVIKNNGLTANTTVGKLKSMEQGNLWQNNVNPNSLVETGAVSTAPAKSPVRAGSDTGLTDIQNIERRATTLTAREAPYENQLQEWSHGTVKLPVQQTRIDTMRDLLHGVRHGIDDKGNALTSIDPKLSLESAFDSLRQQGTLGAVLNMAQEGVQAHTPWGTIALSAPVKTALASLNMSPAQQQRFGQFTMELARDRLEQSNLKQFGQHPNQAEFSAAQSVTPGATDPSVNLDAYIAARHADLVYQKKAHQAYRDWRENNPPEALASRFFNSKEHRALEDAREEALRKASRKAMQ